MFTLIFLQTTTIFRDSIFTECGISHSHYMLISQLPHQEVEGMVVLLEANKAAQQLTAVRAERGLVRWTPLKIFLNIITYSSFIGIK